MGVQRLTILLCGLAWFGPAQAIPQTEIDLSGGGLRITQGEQHVQLGGRIQADAVAFRGGDPRLFDGTDVRRARLFVKGALDEHWQYKFQYDFADATPKDLFIKYRGLSLGNLSLGQFTPPISLENMGSSKWTLFMERAMVINALLPDRELGIGFDTSHGKLSFAAALTGDNLAADDTGSDGLTALSRLVWAPQHSPGQVLHFGLSLGQVSNDATETARFSARPEARIDDTPKLVAVQVSGVRRYQLGGLEWAWAQGPLLLQAEYLAARLSGGGDPLFDGYYLAGAWMFGGDRRSYSRDSAVFGRPLRARASWEIAARISEVDFTDQQLGNRQRNISLGLNWFPIPNIRFALNLIDTEIRGVDSPSIAALRAQLVF